MSFTQLVPTPPEWPLPEAAKSSAAKEAKELHAEFTRKYEAIGAVHTALQAAIAEVHRLERDLDAELLRASQAAEVSTKDLAISQQLEQAKAACDGDLWRRRVGAAEDAARTAGGVYRQFVADNLPALVSELEDDAQKVTDRAVNAEHAAAEARTGYQQLRSRVLALIPEVPFVDENGLRHAGRTAPALDVPDFPSVPVPDFNPRAADLEPELREREAVEAVA